MPPGGASRIGWHAGANRNRTMGRLADIAQPGQKRRRSRGVIRTRSPSSSTIDPRSKPSGRRTRYAFAIGGHPRRRDRDHPPCRNANDGRQPVLTTGWPGRSTRPRSGTRSTAGSHSRPAHPAPAKEPPRRPARAAFARAGEDRRHVRKRSACGGVIRSSLTVATGPVPPSRAGRHRRMPGPPRDCVTLPSMPRRAPFAVICRAPLAAWYASTAATRCSHGRAAWQEQIMPDR